jgi:uncharacterized membrane protein YbhN (UPF0104 family)
MDEVAVPTRRRPRSGPVRWAPRVAATLLVAALPVVSLGYLPRVMGATWPQVVTAARSVSLTWLGALTVVWLAGLLAHSLVLTSSLPGLTSRRAVGLNLAGSAVANSVPMGGAISVGLTGAMARSWGFAPIALGGFVAVSTVWNVLVRLVAGLLGLSWLALTHSATVLNNSVWVIGAASLVLVAFAGLLARERTAARLGGMAGALLDRLSPGGPATRGPHLALTVIRARRQTLQLIRRAWLRLSLGMAGYLALLCLLMDLCLHAIGAPQSLVVAAAAVGVERLVSAVPFTPGGAGVAELGMVACLTVCGVNPVAAVAATFIYRIFTFFMEIPVGLAVTVAWLVGRRRAALTGTRASAVH